MKTRNSEELRGYCHGVHDAWRAFRYAAYTDCTLKQALGEFAGWIDDVLTPFVRKIGDGEITTAEFPNPPMLGAKVASSDAVPEHRVDWEAVSKGSENWIKPE